MSASLEERQRRARIYEMMFGFAGAGSMGGVSQILILPQSLGGISPLWTFARSQTASTTATNAYRSFDGTGTFAANTPRYVADTYGTLLVEGSRTNLFLASSGPGTQDITVAATAHTFSLGPGNHDTQFDLTGAFTTTIGSTAGAGYSFATFTPSAGTLTCTGTGGGGDAAAYAQLEASPFPSSFIQTAGTSATRGADLISASLSPLGLPSTGAFTALWGGYFDNTSVTGTQTIMHIDDGSNTNRYTLEIFTGTDNLRGYATNGGANTSTASITATPSTYSRVGMTVSSSGRLAFCMSIGTGAPSAVSAITGGPTSGLTTLRVGANAVGSVNFFGRVGYFATNSQTMTDGDLRAAVAAMPIY